MRTKYTSLQYLRAAAALLVVVAHTTEYPLSAAGMIPAWTAGASELGVQIFFVISGFIISTVGGQGRFDPLDFALRRFLRVAPLYWICTTALFLLATVAPDLLKTTTADPRDYLLSLLFIPHAQPGDTLANHWSPLLKPGWTLNLEVFFYAVMAALFWCKRRRTRSILLTLVLGAFVALSFRTGGNPGVLDFYASRNLIAFVVGVWLAEFADGAWSRTSHAAIILPAMGAVTIAAAGGTFAAGEGAVANMALLTAVLVVATAVLVERANRLPDWPRLRAIGDASYSLYLTHLFTAAIVWALIRKVADPTSWPVHAAGVVASLVLAVLVARLSYRLVERPFLALGATRRTLPNSGVACAPHRA